MANEAVVAAVKRPKKAKPKLKATNDEEEPLAPGDKSSLNEVLQQAYVESTQNEGKKKKKVRSHKAMLESLKKGDVIRKDSDESMLLANTYDPDDDPKNKKSNKRRQREMENKQKGVDNVAYTEENEITERKPRRKPKKTLEENTDDKPLTIEELAPPVTQKKKKKVPKPEVQSEPETPASPPAERKKKKKKPVTEDQKQVLSEAADGDDPSKVTSDPEESQSKVKKKKQKKKKEATDDETTPREIEDHGRIVSLSVHRTDKLKTDFLIAHPVVRVSIVDESTGNYLKKQHEGRHVTSYYEHDNVDFILPMMTQPFDFKQNKSTLPVWEELLLFNENYDYLTQEDHKAILFFEILDFMSMNAVTQRQNVGQDSGWHRIAWGFLKVIGANGKPNTDKKVRLQLYQPPVRFRAKADQFELYQWYKSPHLRIPYPSTLYVTVKGIIPPETVEPAPRSMFATQEEKGRATYDEMQKTLDGTSARREGRAKGPSLWTRLAGQLCKIPNVLAMSLPAGKLGCYVVRFSLDGKYLACGCHDKDGYPIVIYEVSSGKPKGQVNGHFRIIYDMSWSRCHTQLMTASADGTARIWDVLKMSNTPLKTLPHPSFVYAARYHPRVNKIVVTGGYDRMIRIWTLKGDEHHGQLLQELDGHLSFVNTLCFDPEGQRMFSGDSLGDIKVWTVNVTDKPSSNGFLREWTKEKDIVEPEIKGVPINTLKVHPSARRLLIQTRDNILRLYDFRIGAIMQRYEGALNFREHIRCTMTPCGSFVISGSEDSCAYVWNSDSGDQVASYQELGYRQPVSDVDYHPHDHMVAFCSFGDNHQVVVYKYDHKVAQRDVGLEPVEKMSSTHRTGRPMSPMIKPGVDLKSDDEENETYRAQTSVVNLDLPHSARMDRARRKLDSVLAFQSGTYNPLSSGHPLGVQTAGSTIGNTWGSTFDSTAIYTEGRTMSPEPSAFSPHASRDILSSSIQQQQLSSQTLGSQQGSGWKPSFTGVGRFGSPSVHGRPPISISAISGAPQVQFHGRKTTKDWVVALYDYKSQRSDELTFTRGDDLWVICKDTDTWWLARDSSGQEGYIPANYVTSQGKEKNDILEYKISLDQVNKDENDVRKSTTTAVVSKSGELKFISATEDSDAEPSVRRKKNTRKPRSLQSSQDTVINIDSEAESVTSTRVHRKRRTKTRDSTA